MIRSRCLVIAAAVVAAVLVGAPAFAQEGPFVPTKDNPLRFSAFAVQMQAGVSTRVNIVVDRWSTDEERKALIALIGEGEHREDQQKLIDALQDIKPRVGFISTAGSLGWDLKYAHENQLPDGGRQIVIVTDKPVSFAAVRSNARTLDYAFSLIALKFPAGSDKGEGILSGQTAISVKDGRIELETFGIEPTRLTTVTQESPKKKK